MKLLYFLTLFPTLVFGQNIKLICEENSLIDYVDDKFIKLDASNQIELQYTFNKELSFLNEAHHNLNYKYMGEDKVSYHFRIETDFSFNTLILYKNIYRYERNIFYPRSTSVKKTFFGSCYKLDNLLAINTL